MRKLKVACLCPVYGHGPNLINNTAACFYNQQSLVPSTPFGGDLLDLTLIFIDDRTEGERLTAVRTPTLSNRNCMFYHLTSRAPNLCTKYNTVLNHIAHHPRRPCHNEIRIADVSDNMEFIHLLPSVFDVIALWDDDDVYMPWHLMTATSRIGLTSLDSWYYPNWVGSTYDRYLHLEKSGGRFWASSVFGARMLVGAGGFPPTDRADFDQQALNHFKNYRDPLTSDIVSYIYRWEDTRAPHASAYMRDPGDCEWRDRIPQFNLSDMGAYHVYPDFDHSTEVIYKEHPKPSDMDLLPRWGA